MAQTILVVDDEPRIVALVKGYLEASGFRVAQAFSGTEAISAFRVQAPDCVVLDINMPGMDGLAVAQEIRKSSEAPIIFLSARAEELDRVVGLEIGADDYVTKPFSPRELTARVKAVLRRSGPRLEAPDCMVRGGLRLDREKRTVTLRGRLASLTSIQFDLLCLLMRRPGKVWTRLEILEALPGSAREGYERTIDAHVKNLRKALGDDTEDPRFIETVRGAGYRFMEQGDEA